MKATIKTIIATTLLLLSCCFVSSAQRGSKDWQEKIQTQKIAYLTSTMGLSSKEAQDFWPLYNKMEDERKESFKRVMDSYNNLSDGLENGKSEREISVLLDKYTLAVKNSHSVESKYVPQFEKIISVEKVARMFVGEESFRRSQIHRFNDKGPESNKK